MSTETANALRAAKALRTAIRVLLGKGELAESCARVLDDIESAMAVLTAERDAARIGDIARHVEAEREACAKVCEANAAKQHYGDPLYHAHMADARDIRSRGKP